MGRSPVEEAGNINLVSISDPADRGGRPLAAGQVGVDVAGRHVLPGPDDPHIQQVSPGLQADNNNKNDNKKKPCASQD